MKGNAKVIEALNGLLKEELTAISQYFVHAEMAENWGYGKLLKLVRARSISEMKHAEEIIERIIFLEGTPQVGELNKINVGADVAKQLANDLRNEMTAVQSYNSAIKVCRDSGDDATRDILTKLLRVEDDHVNEIEEKLDQIKQMGIQDFLATLVGE